VTALLLSLASALALHATPPACDRFAKLFPEAEPPADAEPGCRRALDEACSVGRGPACLALAELLLAEPSPAAAPIDALLESGCREGVGEACLVLADRVEPARRGALVEAGCGSGSARACLEHARLAPAGSPAAIRRLERGCDLGSGEACLALATLPATHGALQSRKRLPLLERSCQLGTAAACAQAGAGRAYGLEPGDPDRSVRLFERGCSLRDPESCARLGLVLLRGTIITRDEVRGRALLTAYCDALGAAPCLDAAEAWLGGQARLFEVSRSLPLLEAGAARGIPAACHLYARELQEGRRVQADGARAAALYGVACEGGIMAACADLGVLYLHGAGVEAEPARARALLERACAGGVADACGHFERSGGP